MTSTSAPGLSRTLSPFSSVNAFSTRISRYSSSASSTLIWAFSGSSGTIGLSTFCTLPRNLLRFFLLMKGYLLFAVEHGQLAGQAFNSIIPFSIPVIRQNSVQPRNQQLAHYPQPANLL